MLKRHNQITKDNEVDVAIMMKYVYGSANKNLNSKLVMGKLNNRNLPERGIWLWKGGVAITQCKYEDNLLLALGLPKVLTIDYQRLIRRST